jgi:transglutaminase-like putative cysteine protease
LSTSTLIRDSGQPDEVSLSARETPVAELPNEMLRFLLSSRYCEVDLFSNIAYELFGQIAPGWNRVQAICDWVHNKVTFNYQQARPTKTAMDVYTERVGVCRDFQHLAITFCRALNIPARYATGYLGDIGVPVVLPMDFSAWFEVWLDGRWWAFDARNNQPRIGRVLMATGRDAADVALTTSFGQANLRHFFVVTEEETPASLDEPQELDPTFGLPYFVSPPGA